MPTASVPIPVSSAPATGFVPETRAWLFDPTRRFSPLSIRDEIERAAGAGFNVVLFPVFINGYTIFPSTSARGNRFAPIDPHYRRWDPVAEAAAVAHGLGINFWGFVRPYNFHSRYSVSPQKLLRKFPDWRIRIHPYVRRSTWRQRESYVACPVNPDYRRYLAEVLVELVMAYPVDGLVINYTGYGLRRGPVNDYPFCFCGACRAIFAEQTGRSLVDEALTVEGIDRVHNWQIEESTTSIEYLRHRLIKCRRTLRLICRARPQWRANIEEAGADIDAPYCLDWNGMLNVGSVEELLIDHDDETAPEMFRTRLVTDLASLHDEALLLPAIRIAKPEDLDEPLRAVRRYPVGGFLAEFVKPPTDRDVEFIRDHYLAEPAHSPDHHPLLAVAFFLRRVQSSHRDNELIADFMRDFLRLIENLILKEMSFETLQVILENLSGLQAAIRRGRLGDYPIPESTQRDLGLARRIVRLACLDVRS